MSKYMLFGGATYYACGGAYDYICTVSPLESAKEAAQQCLDQMTWSSAMNNRLELDWVHVMDVDTGLIVAKYGTTPHGVEDDDE